MRKLLYIAGPYTHPDPVENTHRACKVADVIYAQTDFVPVIPHVSLLWHVISPQPPQFWYDYDLEVLHHCDAIVRLPGHSTGADTEMERAAEWGIEIVDYEFLPIEARAAWER